MDFYEIRVKGHISPKRMQTFAGLTAKLLPNGETVLQGQIADQGALHGILRSISDLGLNLLLVQQKETCQEESKEL
ncbi:MAG: hypothetical protein JWP00_361 [Chloroflexi bacterium]|jgi:hypothetical protein|nr:hypothetical protein [Chloroflexota bacterium]